MNVRILIVSNEPFDKKSSNGRTLMNMLLEYDKESLAQFYLHGTPDSTFCKNYYQVSDRSALNAFLRRKQNGNKVPPEEKSSNRKIRRNCRNCLIRDIVWMSYAWWDSSFEKFISDFSPEIVLLQAGDAPFMYALARKIAKKYDCKLMMYNSENYVLKKYLYHGAKQDGIWHTLLQKRLKYEYAQFMKKDPFCIYSMGQLEEDYQKVYPHSGRSTTLYTVSELHDYQRSKEKKKTRFEVVYCGNLGVGRAEPLAEVAKALHRVHPAAKLRIYGRFVSKVDEALVCEEPAVEYCGVIPYDSVPDVLCSADMILHCENKNRVVNLRNAFSTKIADSLAIGTPFLVYASREYPFVRYLLRNRCAHIAETQDELETILRKSMEDSAYRDQYLEAARNTAIENHSVWNNCRKFNAIIDEVAKSGDEQRRR